MTVLDRLRDAIGRALQQPTLNYIVTNHIPRRQLTRFMARFSRIEQPWIRFISITLWKFFADVDLSDAKEQTFRSLHACFIRELRTGARPIDPAPDSLISPCDALVGATGTVTDGLVLQAKGQTYTLDDLLCDPTLAQFYEGGSYVTLRLTAGMYHRFHAPEDCTIEQVTFIPGDVWNVNTPALERVERLYCRNERAVIRCRAPTQELITLVPVGAILVASIRLHCLEQTLNAQYRGPLDMTCSARYHKGEELGWFEHGSTIIAFAPAGWRIDAAIAPQATLRMGQRLFERAS